MNDQHNNHRTTLPLHQILRRRRQELRLKQAHIAEALEVTAGAVGLWECGGRRMEMDKLPRIAEILRLDKRDLCLAALKQFHPVMYAAVFGREASDLPCAAEIPEKNT
jgi:transcriptional regulator with XRE-family HTH domain